MNAPSNNHVVLVFPKTGPDFLEPPFGLISLATQLNSSGYRTTLIDTRLPNYRKKLFQVLSDAPPLFVGISVMTGPQIYHGIKISRSIRKHFSYPIVWGGLHCTLLPDQTLLSKEMDFILRGYCDETVVKFANALSSHISGQPLLNPFKEISGIGFLDGQSPYLNPTLPTPPLTSLPDPDWSCIDLSPYINSTYLEGRTAYFFTSRGCQYNCTFCYSLPIHNKRWQGRTAEQIIKEIEQVYKITPFEVAFFHDDNFSVDKSRLFEVARYLHAKNIKYVISANCAAVNLELLDLLRDTGCLRLDFAIESGSPDILRKYNKGFTLDKARTAIQQAALRNIPLVISFIAGHPDEGQKELEETLCFIDEIRSIHPQLTVLDIKTLTPYPGTSIFNLCVERGFTPPTTLAAWGDLYWNATLLPWSPIPELCRDLGFISLFAFRHKHLHGKNCFLQLAFKLLHHVELFRWKKRFFSIPIELRFMRFFLRFYGRLMQYFDPSFL